MMTTLTIEAVSSSEMSTRLCAATYQKRSIFTFVAVRTSNLALLLMFGFTFLTVRGGFFWKELLLKLVYTLLL
jgi:hypothetical protein